MESVMSGMAGVLTTERLELRAFRDTDLVELHEIFSDPATHTIGSGPITDIEVTREWIRGRKARRKECGVVWYAVRPVRGGALLGGAGLFMGRTKPFPEIGFEIRHFEQGKGLGREAASAVVSEAHRTGFDQVWATVREWNIASLRALDAVGFQRDRVEHDERGALIYVLAAASR